MRAFFEDSKVLCSKAVHCSGWMLLIIVYSVLASSTNLGVQKQQHLTTPQKSQYSFFCLGEGVCRITEIHLWTVFVYPLPSCTPSRWHRVYIVVPSWLTPDVLEPVVPLTGPQRPSFIPPLLLNHWKVVHIICIWVLSGYLLPETQEFSTEDLIKEHGRVF